MIIIPEKMHSSKYLLEVESELSKINFMVITSRVFKANFRTNLFFRGVIPMDQNLRWGPEEQCPLETGRHLTMSINKRTRYISI